MGIATVRFGAKDAKEKKKVSSRNCIVCLDCYSSDEMMAYVRVHCIFVKYDKKTDLELTIGTNIGC